jgi:hypothetical protein
MSFNVELISKMRNGLYVLVAMGCLAFSSCSKDSLGLDSAIEQRAATTQTVKMSLGLNINPDRENEDIVESGDKFKAFDTQNSKIKIKDGLNKFIIDDTGKNTSTPSKRGHIDMEDLQAQAANIKFYLQIRKGNQIVGSDYATWEYNSRGKKVWRLNGKNINLTGVTPGTDKLEARVVAGGNLNVADNKLEVPSYISKVVEGDSEVEFPIPYASDWLELSYDASNSLYTIKDDAQIKLKPLGILVVTTFRRENKGELNGASLTGVRFVTNSLYFKGHYTLDASDKVQFTSTDEQVKTPILDDVYYTATFDFGKRITVGTTPSPTMVITWAASARKSRSTGWNTSIPATQNEKSLDKMFSAAITHVYAEGVQKDGVALEKPNYNIVPIMGTSVPFRDGTSATFNTELSVPEPMWLGYLAKYTVAADGNSFDTSHDDDKVSLVNWKVARDFLKGKTMPDGKTYYMGNTGLASTLGHYASAFRTDDATGTYMTKMTGSSGRISYVRATATGFASWLTFGNKKVGESVSRAMMQVYDPVNAISYGLFGQDPNAATTNRRNRSQATSTSIIRREYAWPNGRDKYPPGRATLTSITLGKYFIGNIYTPIYKLITGDEPALWTSNEAMKNKVQRYVPAGGRYVKATEAELDNQTPANTQRIDIHKLPLYWYYSYSGLDLWTGWTRFMLRLNKLNTSDSDWNKTGLEWKQDATVFDQVPLSKQKMFLDDPTNKVPNPNYQPGGQGGNIYFYGTDGAQLPAIDFNDNFMWMALLPYSQTYVGDSAD